MANRGFDAMLRGDVMIRPILCLLAAGVALAQEEPPRALPVDPPLQQDPGRDYFQHGVNLYQSAVRANDLDARVEGLSRAIEVLSRYLDQFPNNANAEPAMWYLGESYYRSGRTEDAKRCYHAILRNHGNGRYAAAAAFMLAADHFNHRQYALAAPLFEKMAEVATRPADRQKALFHAGFSFELHGRTREAGDYYRKVIADPETPNPYLNRAQLHLGKLLAGAEKLQEALDLLDDAATTRGTADVRGPAAIEAGTVAAKMGNQELSDKYLRLVLDTAGLEAYRPQAQIALMKARYDSKQFQAVVDLFRGSPVKAEGDQEGLRLMLAARSYMELKRNVEALELFREVEKAVPPENQLSFEANYLRLLCFYRIEGRHVPEQVDAFLQLHRKRRPRDPKIHTALLMKAESLMGEKKADEAAKVYNEIDSSLLSKSNQSGYLYNRARCQMLAEDPQGAIRSLSEFITAFPKDERVNSAILQRASAYRDTGEAPRALADYDLLTGKDIKPEVRETATLEAADIAKSQGNLENTIVRYRNFLQEFPAATVIRRAKANYWLAWALVKTDQGKAALPHAEEARKLDEKTYGKNAGSLLALSYWILQDPVGTCKELDRAIEEQNVAALPDQLITWAAMQAFSSERHDQAARFYRLVTDDENARATPKETWRNYAKSLLAAGQPKEALNAVEHALEVEENEAWKADGLLDKASALLALGQFDAALKAAEECQLLRPQNRVGAAVRIVKGDIYMKQNQPAKAAQEYVAVVPFLADDDRQMKPEALWKLEQSLQKSGNGGEADKYRQQRVKTYPDWQPPKA